MPIKKKNRKRSLKIAIIIIIFILLFYYFFVISPVIKTYTASETNALTEFAVNRAVNNTLSANVKYDSLIDINYTATGEISSFVADQFAINNLSREIVNETNRQMEYLGEEGLNINIGTFSGIPFLIGRGPKINLKLTPIGIVSSEFESVFESVGINMTKHTLYLNINVHVNIVLPIKAYDIYTTNQVLLAESIIVGKVPEVYLNGSIIGKTLNLLP